MKTWLCPVCKKELERTSGENKRVCPDCGAEMIPYSESNGDKKKLKPMED